MGRKWRVPPPRGHILSLGKAGLFVQCVQSSLCACVCRSIRVGVCLKNPQNCTITLTWRVSAESVTLYPVAHVIDQIHIATCGIPQQILLPTDLINGPQTETLILHQTPTDPLLPPPAPNLVPSISSPLLSYPRSPSQATCYQFPCGKCLLFYPAWGNVVNLEKSNEKIL